jgi:hypothetical protein
MIKIKIFRIYPCDSKKNQNNIKRIKNKLLFYDWLIKFITFLYFSVAPRKVFMLVLIILVQLSSL